MSCWTSETEKIIKAHQAELTAGSWQETIRKAGGYNAYLRSLGGVFKKWARKTANVKTAAELQEIAQYVFGLMALYGFNYNNDVTRIRWGGGHAFYPSANQGRCNWGRIDDLCSRTDLDKTTNCNFGTDSLLYKAGVMPRTVDYSYRFKYHAQKFRVIRKKADLHPGYLVHFFHGAVTSDDPDSWRDWGHVACVGEVRGGTVTLYDSGSRFIRSGNFKHEFTVDGNNRPTGAYDNYDGWVGIALVELAGETKGDGDLAVEVIAGKWGSSLIRKARLGRRYDAVQARVNYFLGGSAAGRAAYLRAAAGYVLKGYAGTDEERRKFFGKDYQAVQDKVNWVIRTAGEVIANKYGRGDDRKAALGIDYDLVQSQVNRMV